MSKTLDEIQAIGMSYIIRSSWFVAKMRVSARKKKKRQKFKCDNEKYKTEKITNRIADY